MRAAVIDEGNRGDVGHRAIDGRLEHAAALMSGIDDRDLVAGFARGSEKSE